MKKSFFLWIVVNIFLFTEAWAQSSSVVIDNQVPGWLSSKMTYEEQLAVRELKVTGYINKVDVDFINNLINNYGLNQSLDLYDAHIVAYGDYNTNFLWPNFLDMKPRKILEKFILPQSLDSIGGHIVPEYATVDSVFLGYKRVNGGFLDGTYNHVVLMEGVKEIMGGTTEFLEKIVNNLPESLECIGSHAFSEPSGSDIIRVNNIPKNLIKVGGKMRIDDGMYLGGWFDRGGIQVEKKGTLSLPSKLICWNSVQTRGKCGDYFIADTIIVPETCETLCANLKAHVGVYYPKVRPIISKSECMSFDILYVPEGCKEEYARSYTGKIREMKKINDIQINTQSVSITVGKNYKLSVQIYPGDAFNKQVIWSSSDERVAKVDRKGVVTAKKAGKAVITVMSVENNEVENQCEVVVIQPVSGIVLDKEELVLSEIGQPYQLLASVLPEDATNKRVKWSSFNENVCRVYADGSVVAVANGESIVMAETVDGGFFATCNIKVIDGSTGISDKNLNVLNVFVENNSIILNNKKGNEIVKIFTIDGKCVYVGLDDRIPMHSGLYIVKIGNHIKKIVVK